MQEHQVFEILKNYFKEHGTSHIQLDSFNNFVLKGIQQIVDQKGVLSFSPKKGQEYFITFGQVFVEKPVFIDENRVVKKLMPAEARMRDLCYESSVHIDIETKRVENDVVIEKILHQRVLIGKIPSMLYSVICNLHDSPAKDRMKNGECSYDEGGYFIINGKERVIVSQQRPNYNFVQVLKMSKTSTTKYKYISEIRSVAEDSGYSILVQTMFSTNDRNIFISLPNIKEPILAGIVFKALGFPDDIESFIDMRYEQGKPFVKYIIQDATFIQTREEAIAYIGKYPLYTIPKEKRDAYAKQIVEMELFPHLGITATTKDKARFLGYMINKLISTVIEVRQPDDRDNVSNKRIEATGMLMYDLFRGVFDRFLKNIQKQLPKKDIITLINQNTIITRGIRFCFSTGNWGARNSTHIKMGVSQVLNRMTYAATLSHLRHIVIPIGKEGKNAKIRQINTSQFGFICPAETPEGQTSGIVTNFTAMAKVSKKTSTILTKESLLLCKNIRTEIDDTPGVKVMLNGRMIGMTKNHDGLIEEIVEKRLFKLLDMEVSVIYDIEDDEVRIYSDEGRLMRPLFVVNDRKIYSGPVRQWEELLAIGAVRYIDSNESENSVIAMYQADLEKEYVYDFCEIHPSMILGVCASIIPFPDHSQSPRNCYQSSMAKQALGIPVETYNNRSDTMMYVMDYPQRPLVSTKAAEYMGFNEMPSGANPIVAIMPKEGFNQEDSVILNKSAIERGMFRVTAYFTVSDEETRRSSSKYQSIELPPIDIRNKSSNYAFLETTGEYAGIIKTGYRVKKDDVIIGKVLTNVNKDGIIEKKDISVVIKPGEEGYIHKVTLLATLKGCKMVKIMIRTIKTPEVGDKFASRAAQKGTCGMIFAQEDMPFTSCGMTPDIIINPHCIPSRMTINQLLECILGKSCAEEGTFGDATPFSENSVNVADNLCNRLETNGFERHGLETMYNPYTGKKLEANIFMGPTYYQRLKHMVSDKIHSRAKGSVTTLTRQPLEGRSRDGGLRFGEMERDAMIVHGSSRFLKERLFDMSDPYNVIVCSICGMIATSQVECKGCKDDKLFVINIPYAAKLLFQELNSMGIKTELIPKK